MRLISFTGETTTGKIIMKNASDTLKRLSMELGGKAPNLIFESADLDRAVEVTMRASFFNQGRCAWRGPASWSSAPSTSPSWRGW